MLDFIEVERIIEIEHWAKPEGIPTISRMVPMTDKKIYIEFVYQNVVINKKSIKYIMPRGPKDNTYCVLILGSGDQITVNMAYPHFVSKFFPNIER